VDEKDRGLLYIIPRDPESAEQGQIVTKEACLFKGTQEFNQTLWGSDLKTKLDEPIVPMGNRSIPAGFTRTSMINALDIRVLGEQPMGTSSSMLRCALYEWYENNTKEMIPIIAKLTGFTPVEGDPWHNAHLAIRDDKTLFVKCPEQLALASQLMMKGGKRKRRRGSTTRKKRRQISYRRRTSKQYSNQSDAQQRSRK
jgi:hypothetical protein